MKQQVRGELSPMWLQKSDALRPTGHLDKVLICLLYLFERLEIRMQAAAPVHSACLALADRQESSWSGPSKTRSRGTSVPVRSCRSQTQERPKLGQTISQRRQKKKKRKREGPGWSLPAGRFQGTDCRVILPHAGCVMQNACDSRSQNRLTSQPTACRTQKSVRQLCDLSRR